MYLKSLEITGFKSFPDKTVLHFDNGLTAVVGPNGSGKSNISDAVRWVMGEQSTKTLRSGKMEDVIFGGTKSRRPQGYAQVSLCIDNSEGELPVEAGEVTVTRKLYRSGESEYRLNGNSVRLKDIYELFMDTGIGRDGYSIIGQGRIAEIVAAKSGERREIFEEAAGISKFRYRKAEAVRKLQQAEENMVRLKDILQELEGRVGPLERQAAKAKEFLALAEEKKSLEISLWLEDLSHMKEQLGTFETHFQTADGDYRRISGELEALEEKSARLYEQMQQTAVFVDEARRESAAGEEQAAQLHAKIAVLENDIRHNDEAAAKIGEELAAFAAGAEAAARHLESREQAYEAAEGRLAESRTLLARREQALAASNGALVQNEQQQMQLNTRIHALNTSLSAHRVNEITSKNAAQELEQRMQVLGETIRVKQEQLAQTASEVEECKKLSATLASRLEEAGNVEAGYRAKLQGRTAKLEALRKSAQETELTALDCKRRAKLLRDLEESMEGFAFSVKTIMNSASKGALQGIVGPISGLIDVRPEYAQAIETALGPAMQNIVTDNSESAKRAIFYLREKKAGRATFLPQSEMRGRALEAREIKTQDGFVGVASGLIAYDSQYRGILQFLLGRVLVAQDLHAATAIAKANGYRYRVVSLDGQQVNAGGSLTGGYSKKSQNILGRRHEIEALVKQGAGAEEQLAALRAEGTQVQEQLRQLEQQMRDAQGDVQQMRADQIRFASEQKRLEQQLAGLDAEIRSLRTEEQQLAGKLGETKSLGEDSAGMTAQINEEIGQITERLRLLSDERAQAAAERETLATQIGESRLQVLSQEKDLEALAAELARLRDEQSAEKQRAGDLERQREWLTGQNTQIRAEMEGCARQREQCKEAARRLTQEIAQAMQRRELLEKENAESRQAEKELLAQKEAVSKELARLGERKLSLQNEYDAIVAKLWDDYGLTRGEALETAVPVEDRAQAQSRLALLKGRIKALGSVNVAAIEEYREVSERYAFLKTQVEDVQNSACELQKLIDQLTFSMREIFKTSFGEIDRHFGLIFKELFGGGSARLALTDSEDVLESGIEIYVEPPGKIIKNLASLSGGEQAFVAIAIYFAILKVRPAPFCILDEIEAALDDVNVVKYASYLRRISEKTQFILITHRRGTMEEADVLYGVTMQEEGVSKLLELRVGELENSMVG